MAQNRPTGFWDHNSQIPRFFGQNLKATPLTHPTFGCVFLMRNLEKPYTLPAQVSDHDIENPTFYCIFTAMTAFSATIISIPWFAVFLSAVVFEDPSFCGILCAMILNNPMFCGAFNATTLQASMQQFSKSPMRCNCLCSVQ